MACSLSSPSSALQLVKEYSIIFVSSGFSGVLLVLLSNHNVGLAWQGFRRNTLLTQPPAPQPSLLRLHQPGQCLYLSLRSTCPPTLMPTFPRLRVRDKLLQRWGKAPPGPLSCCDQGTEHTNSVTARSSQVPQCLFQGGLSSLSPVSPSFIFLVPSLPVFASTFTSLFYFYIFTFCPFYYPELFPPFRISSFPGLWPLPSALRAPPGHASSSTFQMLLAFWPTPLPLPCTW